VSSNLAHGEVYSIQHCVIKIVIDLRLSSCNKTEHHNIQLTEILLNVALDIKTLTPFKFFLNEEDPVGKC